MCEVLTFLFVRLPSWWRDYRHAAGEFVSDDWLKERVRLRE